MKRLFLALFIMMVVPPLLPSIFAYSYSEMGIVCDTMNLTNNGCLEYWDTYFNIYTCPPSENTTIFVNNTIIEVVYVQNNSCQTDCEDTFKFKELELNHEYRMSQLFNTTIILNDSDCPEYENKSCEDFFDSHIEV